MSFACTGLWDQIKNVWQTFSNSLVVCWKNRLKIITTGVPSNTSHLHLGSVQAVRVQEVKILVVLWPKMQQKRRDSISLMMKVYSLLYLQTACTSWQGFHEASNTTTRLAPTRLIPRHPALRETVRWKINLSLFCPCRLTCHQAFIRHRKNKNAWSQLTYKLAKTVRMLAKSLSKPQHVSFLFLYS